MFTREPLSKAPAPEHGGLHDFSGAARASYRSYIDEGSLYIR